MGGLTDIYIDTKTFTAKGREKQHFLQRCLTNTLLYEEGAHCNQKSIYYYLNQYNILLIHHSYDSDKNKNHNSKDQCKEQYNSDNVV